MSIKKILQKIKEDLRLLASRQVKRKSSRTAYKNTYYFPLSSKDRPSRQEYFQTMSEYDSSIAHHRAEIRYTLRSYGLLCGITYKRIERNSIKNAWLLENFIDQILKYYAVEGITLEQISEWIEEKDNLSTVWGSPQKPEEKQSQIEMEGYGAYF